MCGPVIVPIKGAVSSQILAQTTHENIHMLCLVDVTNSFVHVKSTACTVVVNISDSIANNMHTTTYFGSEIDKREDIGKVKKNF